MSAPIYFVTFCTWQRLELTCAARQVVMEACQHFHGQRYAIFAGVVMPDHVHLLIQPWLKEADRYWTIGNILHSIKGFSARRVPDVMPHMGKLSRITILGPRRCAIGVKSLSLIGRSQPFKNTF